MGNIIIRTRIQSSLKSSPSLHAWDSFTLPTLKWVVDWIMGSLLKERCYVIILRDVISLYCTHSVTMCIQCYATWAVEYYSEFCGSVVWNHTLPRYPSNKLVRRVELLVVFNLQVSGLFPTPAVLISWNISSSSTSNSLLAQSGFAILHKSKKYLRELELVNFASFQYKLKRGLRNTG